MRVDKIVLYIGSIVGLLDSSYLLDRQNDISSCSGNIKSIFGTPIDCGTVAQSEYSEILGIPVAFFGFLYYLSIFLLIYFDENLQSRLNLKFDNLKVIHMIAFVLSLGLLFSIYLVYLQLVVLNAICLYCMGSAITTLTMFSVTIYVLINK